MILGQNGVLRYGHFGEFLEYFWGYSYGRQIVVIMMHRRVGGPDGTESPKNHDFEQF